MYNIIWMYNYIYTQHFYFEVYVQRGITVISYSETELNWTKVLIILPHYGIKLYA